MNINIGICRRQLALSLSLSFILGFFSLVVYHIHSFCSLSSKVLKNNCWQHFSMKLSLIISTLLLVSSGSALFSRGRRNRPDRRRVVVKAETDAGVQEHTVILSPDTGYGHSRIRERDILEATVVEAADDLDIWCRYTNDPGPKKAWISNPFSKQTPLPRGYRPFPKATGLICYIHVENVVRIALEPGIYEEKVLNIPLERSERYGDNYVAIRSMYKETGALWRIDRAAKIDGPPRADCMIKYDDDTGVNYDMHHLRGIQAFETPLEGCSQIICNYVPLRP